MADEQQIKNFQNAYEAYKALNFSKFLRENLGDNSIAELAESIHKLNEILKIAEQVAPQLSNIFLESLTGSVGAMQSIIEKSLEVSDIDFPAKVPEIKIQFKKRYDVILNMWPTIGFAQIDTAGLLQKDYQSYTDELKKHAESLINLAKEEIRQGVERAAKTARGISIKVAQKQFRLAHSEIKNQVITWSCLSGVSILFFLGIVVWFMSMTPLTPFLYFTGVRISALISLGALATFCFKMLKSSLYMFNRNLHRQKVTNSIGAFMEAALTDEQQDLILAQLVESVISFSSSDKDVRKSLDYRSIGQDRFNPESGH